MTGSMRIFRFYGVTFSPVPMEMTWRATNMADFDDFAVGDKGICARQNKVHPTVQCLGVDITCPWGIDDYAELEKWSPKLQLLDTKSFIDFYPHRWGFFPRVLSKLFPGDKNKFGHSILHMKIKSDAA